MCQILRPVTLDGENGALISSPALISVNESGAGNKNNSILHFLLVRTGTLRRL